MYHTVRHGCQVTPWFAEMRLALTTKTDKRSIFEDGRIATACVTPIVTTRMGSSPVLVYNDKVYLDTYDGDHRGLARIGFTEFDARTGNLMGRDEYGLFFRNCSACDCFDENPVVAKGIMYFVANNNIDYNKTRLHAVDPATAEILWSFDATGSPLAQPTVVNGTIYFGCDDGSVYALEPVSK